MGLRSRDTRRVYTRPGRARSTGGTTRGSGGFYPQLAVGHENTPSTAKWAKDPGPVGKETPHEQKYDLRRFLRNRLIYNWL